MNYLLRIRLPDIPGSLGRVATAIGTAGADIEVLEIVEHCADGSAIDDVIINFGPEVLADAVVTACQSIQGVEVLWISRYAGHANLFRDLELVESLSEDPATAWERLVHEIPAPFRANWAARVAASGVIAASAAAPSGLEWLAIDGPTRLEFDRDTMSMAAAPVGAELVIVGRDGGPDFLDSELARLGHLVHLTRSIARG